MTNQREHLDEIDFSDVADGADLMPPVTPGEILRDDFMAPFGLSANALAKALHVPPNRVTAILKGTRSITADTALRLARYFNTTPQSWLRCRIEVPPVVLSELEIAGLVEHPELDQVRMHADVLVRGLDTGADGAPVIERGSGREADGRRSPIEPGSAPDAAVSTSPPPEVEKRRREPNDPFRFEDL